MSDQYEHWSRAISDGKPIETGSREDGTYVRSGFYRSVTKQGLEAIAFWRDEKTGDLKCRRTVYGDGRSMAVDEIEELFAAVSRYPIEYAVWRAIRCGEPWPDGYEMRLTLQEIRNGVAWTAELRATKLSAVKKDKTA